MSTINVEIYSARRLDYVYASLHIGDFTDLVSIDKNDLSQSIYTYNYDEENDDNI